jgi:ubiquinone/menaquinone biosynthesis C-methylase UbiE
MINVTSCPICGHTDFAPFLVCTDYTISQERFYLVTCSTCNLVITTPRPNNEDLGKYYQSADYISHTSKANSIIDKLYLLARKFTLKRKRNLAVKLQPQKGNLLDVGCGTGDFLHTCMLDGWKASGVEPNENARELAEQKGITAVSSIDKVKGQFSLITLWHVLEHVSDLNETLNTLYNLLEPTGTMLIAVPNHTSTDGNFYKENWAGYDVPRHLWHFNRQNMEQLLLNHKLSMQNTLPLTLDSFYISLLSETYQGKKMTRFVMAFLTGLRSNLSALKTTEYSSLIYLARK